MVMTKQSLLILTYEFPGDSGRQGGIGGYTFDLANAFNSKVDVLVFAPRIGNCREFDGKRGYGIRRVANILIIKEILLFLMTFKHILFHKVDCIFCSSWLPGGIIAFLMNKIFGTPYVVSAHGSEILDRQNSGSILKEELRGRLSFLKKHVYNHAQRVFSVSNYTKRILINDGIRPEKIDVVKNGVDLGRFGPLEVKNKSEMLEGKILLTVSRLDKHKGHDLVIEALPYVLKKIRNVKYLIIGQGPEEQKLRNLVKYKGLNDCVSFLGYVSDKDLVKYYRICDAFIMLSKEISGDFEGFGLVYLEANACGKPVIGARTGGIEDAIIDGETGLLIDDLAAQNVAGTILKLLENEDLANKLGKGGYEAVVKNRTWNQVAERMLKLMRVGAN